MTVPETEALKAELERAAAGRRVAGLTRFTRGAQSANYAGRWSADGSRFVLKLVPSARAEQYARLVEHLEKTAPGVVVREASPRVRFDLDGFHALVLDWCGGEALGFDGLCGIAGGIENFVDDYRTFSATIRGLVKLYPTYAYRDWAEEALASPLAPALPADFKEVDFAVLAEDARVIHGDFQSDNLRFTDGRLSGVLDLEEFRLGSPLEDFARYVCQGVDRMPWWAWTRWRAVRAGVARLRAATGASEAAWRAAVYGQLLWKVRKSIQKGDAGIRRVMNLKWRLRRYHELTRGV